MTRFVHTSLLMLACSVLLLSGCGAGQPEATERTKAVEHPLTCIVVLPVAADPGEPEAASGQLDEGLLAGAQAMDELLRQELDGRSDVRFVDAEYIAGLESTGGETDLEMIRLIARSVECNGVLQSRMRRYSERIGGRFTTEEPAAVTFDMKLIGVDTGGVLWTAHFEETQKSVLENLYEWGKARSRGFTWITARDLLLEGIREKFAASPYFREPREKSPPAAVKSADEKV